MGKVTNILVCKIYRKEVDLLKNPQSFNFVVIYSF